ncbi:hypothetical protein LOAG_19322 [Loa loa]|uniref:Uncharacterized protein n=1 Tax=Loa loa TaxID=7209 RepID=A0A1S0UCI2_LOALO|nr:hypothetical protein LOAG_19322 [Loa loa]EJD73263.1 hypothetical protein LOAG_19322 [Loa loa]
MSSSIIASIQPAKTRLVFFLQEINSLEFESPDPNSSLDQQRILYTTRKQVLADKFDRIQLCVKELEVAYDTGSSIFKPSLRRKKGKRGKGLRMRHRG